jgi:hypothetical protein
MKRTALVSLATMLVLFACQSDRPVAPKPPGITAAIVTYGRGHFFFLPPLVKPVWPPPTFAGVFNPSLTPVAKVCVLVSGSCTIVVQTFTTLTGSIIDPSHVFDRIQVAPQLQAYFAFWNSALAPVSTYYRVTVTDPFTNSTLGFADVQVVGSLAEAAAVWQAGQFAPLLQGAPLVIVFRIEQGALGSSCASDCAEQVVTNAGGTVVTVPNGFAGVRFPAGWLGAGGTQTLVRIDRIQVGVDFPCLTGLPAGSTQYQGCYRFTTTPRVSSVERPGRFAVDATVGMCHTAVTFPPGSGQDLLALWSQEESSEGSFFFPTGTPTELTNVPATFLTNCASFASVAPTGGGWLREFGWKLFHGIETVVTPTPAYADHLGLGGLLGGFSRVGWVLKPPPPPPVR